ncbi:hypothetical protein EC973_002321 [Apophysomyces ossiformis]|uniref:Protein kinase domain-containing protein n=1 Tax=Apophysomyces ossiformis TaxID=679940 RepID=A0A8H7BKT2_9FUNG|nr:hypothetical protein EC973_002321 [Apophysomyces ossiformis]
MKASPANSSTTSFERTPPNSSSNHRQRSGSVVKVMSHHNSPAPSSSAKQETLAKRSLSISEGLHSRRSSSFAHREPHHDNPLPPINHALNLSTTSFSQLSESNWANKYEDFDIKKAIGYGSSAVVYCAVYKPLNKRVAVKMIDLDMFERNQIDELRRETALMALSKHPNVLPVYGSFVNGSKLYIVTPYLSAGSCLDIMKTTFPDGFDEVSIATILKQALEGLVYLHKNNHIHRDVKAGNLLMDEHGTVLLADFGVSSSLSENGDLRRTFVGTPCWMAPEVMEQQGYDYKADIWSFGITALELSMGHAPFAKYPPMKVLMMTLSNDPPTLDRENAKHKYSKSFKDMIDMCLQKDPKKRPSAEKLLQHPFFKQVKKKEYLCKSVLAYVPPLDQRPHKKVPQRHISFETSEQWDFDTQSDSEGYEPANKAQAQAQPQQQPHPAPAPKKHISFGDVVIRDPARPQQMSPVVESPTMVPTPETTAKKSRFVIEETRDTSDSTPGSQQLSASPPSHQITPSMSPPSVSSDSGNTQSSGIGLGISSKSPHEVEVKKGRFSVNQTPQSRPCTPAEGNEPQVSVSTSQTPQQDSRPTPISRATSHDSLAGERRSRFEVQHSLSSTSSHSSNLADQHLRFEGVPLSRENSSSGLSVSRDTAGSCCKISRFSVEKEGTPSVKEVLGTYGEVQPSPECRKKGRFELTGGTPTVSDTKSEKSDGKATMGSVDFTPHTVAGYIESPQSSVTGSPSVSPNNSLSRGQPHQLLDPVASQAMFAQMEALLKQTEMQRAMMQDVMANMAAITGVQTPSSISVATLSAAPTRSKSEFGSIPLPQDIVSTIDHLQHLLLASARDKERLAKENELLKKEVERLRKEVG